MAIEQNNSMNTSYRFAIVAVGLRLPKEWQPGPTYGDVTRLDPSTVTPQQVFDAACHMRTTKLPDPKVNGNAVVSSKSLSFLPKLLTRCWHNFQQPHITPRWMVQNGCRLAYSLVPA
ncbi:hypothetical protein ACNKHM_10700 [Shigella sonnei]